MAKERKYIPRKQFRFWLIRDLQSDELIMKIIDSWKLKRLFTEKIRAAIRLISSLEKGQLDVLFELFPQLETQLAAKYTPPPTPNTSSLETKIERLEYAISQLEGRGLPDTRDHGIPAAKPYGHSAIAAPAPVATTAKPIDAGTIADDFLAFIQ
jgi:hypothetical protein